MDKKLFLLALAGVALAGMKSEAAPKKPGGGVGSGGGGGGTPGPAPGTPAADPIGGAIKGAVGSGLSAGATAALAAIKGAVGAGTAAAGTEGALAHTTAGAVHGAVTGGETASTASGGGAASGGAVAGGVVASAASIAVAVVVVVIVISVIIILSVFNANMALKQAIIAQAKNGAIDLHLFELDLFSRIRDSLGLTSGFNQIDISDPRMNGASQGALKYIQAGGTPLNMHGRRAVFEYRPKPGMTMAWMGSDSAPVAMLRMLKQIRALSLEYLRYRAQLLDRMGNGFYPDLYSQGFASRIVNGNFSDLGWGAAPEWGGFDQFPLLDGQTQYSITHPESLNYGRPSGLSAQEWGPVEWFLARDSSPDTAFLSSPFGDQLLKAARLKALTDVVTLFSLDPTVVFAWEDYVRFVIQRLGISDVVSLRPASPSEPWNGWTFYTDPAFFGTPVAYDVWMIRVPTGNSRMFKRNAGVPLDDKRLGAVWVEG